MRASAAGTNLLSLDRFQGSAAKDISAMMKKELLTALSNKDLLPPRSVYDHFQHRISEKGRRCEASFFFRVVPKADWDEINLLLQKRNLYSDIERVLGFGECLTEFLTAPVPMDSRFRPTVIRLGTLANAIGATYDLFADSAVYERDILSRKSLIQMLSGIDLSEGRSPRVVTPRRIVSKMLTEYFRLLRSLRPDDNSRFVTNLLRADILRLFEAETKTLVKKKHDLKDVRDVKDKSALLFVIMGLPGWLASNSSGPNQIVQHRKWLYSLGEFIGWIDDIRDLEGDSTHGRPNRLAIWLKANDKRSPRRTPDPLIQHLSERASAIMNGWNSSVVGAPRYEQFTLPVAVVSWLGGWRNVESLRSPLHDAAWM